MSPRQTKPVTVRPVLNEKDLETFTRLHHRIYRGDPSFRAPLDRDFMAQLRPSTNPWFEHGRAQLFLAEHDSRSIGRIAALVDDFYREEHGGSVAYFGFFECTDDIDAASALTSAAEAWCRGEGMDRIIGPVQLSLQRSGGVLVEGFEHPNFIHTPQGKPYYADLLRACGYEREVDLYAWRYGRRPLPKQARYIADAVAEREGLEVRNIDADHLEREISVITALYNESYADTYGFVPMTEDEMEAWLTIGSRPDPRISFIAEVDGEPAALAIGVPNTNEIVDDLEGRLYPTGWIRRFYRSTFRAPLSFRQLLFGIKPKFRGAAVGSLSVFLYVTVHRAARSAGYQEAETTMTFSVNERINSGLAVIGAEHYKTYRVFEKQLS